MVYRVNLQLDFFKNLLHFFFGNICPQEFVNPCRVVGKLPRLSLVGVFIHNAGHNLTCLQKLHQLHRAVHCLQCQIGVKSLFKLTGCVCTQTNLFRCDTHVRAVKVCGFKQHRLRAFHNHGIFAAHYACNRNCLFGVGNHKHGGVKASHLSVQCCNGFALFCVSYNNMAVLDGFDGECMHRLSHFNHHIVCDINDIVDGAYTCHAQSFSHPSGRRPDFYILYHSCNVSGAKGRVLNRYLYKILCLALRLFCHLDFGIMEGNIIGCGSLSCNPQNREAVGSVGGNFVFHHFILQIQHLYNILTQFYGFGEDINAVFGCFGEIVSVAAQLLHRAEHPFGNNPTQLACVDFLAACNHRIVQRNRYIIAHSHIGCAGNNR